MGMGMTSVGVADDAAAWVQNPAGLAWLNAPAMEGKAWAHDVMATYASLDFSGDGDEDSDDSASFWGITWSGWEPAKSRGAGAGYANADDFDAFGAGYGAAFGKMPLSWGVNVVDVDPDNDDSNVLVNVGFMYRFEQPEKAPIRVGLTVTDVTDEFDTGPQCNLGVCWPATPELTIAADGIDLTDETDEGPFFNAGAEYKLGKMKEWALRAGIVDTVDGSEFTAGAGYAMKNFRLDAAYAGIADNLWTVSASMNF